MGSFVPIRIIESNNVWTWTLPKCHAYVVMRYLPLFVNVNTIVLIAIERFVAIVLPTQFREFASERSVRLQVAAAWIVALFELGYDLDCVSVSANAHTHTRTRQTHTHTRPHARTHAHAHTRTHTRHKQTRPHYTHAFNMSVFASQNSNTTLLYFTRYSKPVPIRNVYFT